MIPESDRQAAARPDATRRSRALRGQATELCLRQGRFVLRPLPRLVAIFDFDADGQVQIAVSIAPVRPVDHYDGVGVYVVHHSGIARAVCCQRKSRGSFVVTSLLTGAEIGVWKRAELEERLLGKVTYLSAPGLREPG
ncbi:MAG: hypothetical protein AB7F35_16265 [Acetobacteraceae bacterium]